MNLTSFFPLFSAQLSHMSNLSSSWNACCFWIRLRQDKKLIPTNTGGGCKLMQICWLTKFPMTQKTLSRCSFLSLRSTFPSPSELVLFWKGLEGCPEKGGITTVYQHLRSAIFVNLGRSRWGKPKRYLTWLREISWTLDQQLGDLIPLTYALCVCVTIM